MHADVLDSVMFYAPNSHVRKFPLGQCSHTEAWEIIHALYDRVRDKW
jgi:hypothetical protein